jgi:hypothetical protein
VKVSVENSEPKLKILIDPQEFLPKLSLLKDEMMKMKSAIDASRAYELPERHDPLYLFFDNDFLLGTGTCHFAGCGMVWLASCFPLHRLISVATILHCLRILLYCAAATHWPEYLAYNLETDDEEKMQEIKNAAVPYNTVGLLEVPPR